MSDTINAEVLLRLMGWIEKCIGYIFFWRKNKKIRVDKDKMKADMEDAKRASIEGDEDKVNMIVENFRKKKLIRKAEDEQEKE